MARRGTAKLVAPVDGHADEPCLEVFVVLEHSCVLQQADKRFLAHIACVGGLARLAERETIPMSSQSRRAWFMNSSERKSAMVSNRLLTPNMPTPWKMLQSS